MIIYSLFTYKMRDGMIIHVHQGEEDDGTIWRGVNNRGVSRDEGLAKSLEEEHEKIITERDLDLVPTYYR